jgi:hypothetical protein
MQSGCTLQVMTKGGLNYAIKRGIQHKLVYAWCSMQSSAGVYTQIHAIATEIAKFNHLLLKLVPSRRGPLSLKDKGNTSRKPQLNTIELGDGSIMRLVQFMAPLLVGVITETLPAIPLKFGSTQQKVAVTINGYSKGFVFDPPLHVACVYHCKFTGASTLRIYVVTSMTYNDTNPAIQTFLSTTSITSNVIENTDSWTSHNILTTWENGCSTWNATTDCPQGMKVPELDLTSFLPVVCGRLTPTKFSKKTINYRTTPDGFGQYVTVSVPVFADGCMSGASWIPGYLYPQSCIETERINTEDLRLNREAFGDEDEDGL